MGPYQPVLKPFSPTFDGKQNCRFSRDWYDQFSWLEYSPATDSDAFCFPCHLFETSPPKYKTFTIDGFNSWKRINGSMCYLLQHVGEINSTHMKAVGQFNDLKNSTQHIDNVLNTQSQDEILKWRLRLTVSIECLRLIALQGLAFRGHDESNESENRGNFLEFMKFQGKMNPNIGDVILENALKNAKYTSPRIQKELLNLLAERVRRKIREEVGDAKYCILVDEAQDSFTREQMALVLRFVNRGGLVRERFFEVVSVKDTSVLTLKDAICNVLSHYNLQVDKCPSAYYVHCFAHRLQLALVASSKLEPEIWKFFSTLGTIVNLVVGSSKRQSELQGAHADEIEELLILGELDSGKGANQMCNLQRPGATRWSSHYGAVCRLISMFGSTITVLKNIMENGSSYNMRAESKGAHKAAKSFMFVLMLHLAQKTMAITDVLCQALQKKSQDIINAMSLKYEIIVPNLHAPHKSGTCRLCHQPDSVPFTVADHYRISLFTSLIDYLLKQLSSRFIEGAMELLSLTSSLDPKNAYQAFSIDKICTLATKYYSEDFTSQELYGLRGHLQHYQLDVPYDLRFKSMKIISELFQGLVESGKSNVYPLVDRLIWLVLTLPVSTATTE